MNLWSLVTKRLRLSSPVAKVKAHFKGGLDTPLVPLKRTCFHEKCSENCLKGPGRAEAVLLLCYKWSCAASGVSVLSKKEEKKITGKSL
jgi:hypothetical protein